MTLPVGYTQLPFSAARGIPQTVPFQDLRVTILASSSDLPAVIQTPQTQIIVNMNERCTARPTEVPADERDLFHSAPPSTLDAIRPVIVVRTNDSILGTQPAFVGTPLRFGLVGSFEVEIFVETLKIAAATITQPGEVGAQMSIGIRTHAEPLPRVEKEEDLYDLA
jgi:hypothetical protein